MGIPKEMNKLKIALIFLLLLLVGLLLLFKPDIIMSKKQAYYYYSRKFDNKLSFMEEKEIYQKIGELGDEILPFIIKDLQNNSISAKRKGYILAIIYSINPKLYVDIFCGKPYSNIILDEKILLQMPVFPAFYAEKNKKRRKIILEKLKHYPKKDMCLSLYKWYFNGNSYKGITNSPDKK